MSTKFRTRVLVLPWLLSSLFYLPTLAALAGTASNTTPCTISNAPIYPPLSEPFKLARRILLEGNYDAYVHQLERSGTKGDMQCLSELANLYSTGRIVAQDNDKARAIWQELAAKNYAPAYFYLGLTISPKKDFWQNFST